MGDRREERNAVRGGGPKGFQTWLILLKSVPESTTGTVFMKSSPPTIWLVLLLQLGASGFASDTPKLTLEMFRTGSAPCYDRTAQPQTSVVDSHLHFRPFGGPAIPFGEVVSYLERTGVLFVNVYGIGQRLPVGSSCTYYLDCPGTPVRPTLTNDFANAADYVRQTPDGVHMTLSMTFPDLSRPESILPGMQLLEKEYPGVFTWMGEVNLVKQALFNNGHRPVPPDKIPEWAAFMTVLRERNIPLAVHADLGNDNEPTRYLPLIEEMLRLYPDNKIVWLHMGLSKELVNMDPGQHIRIMETLLDRYPKLMVDTSWRVVDDHYFSKPEKRPAYVSFLNRNSERVLPGTDFLASANKDFDVYRSELQITSGINRDLNDEAFRNIALGQNYFRLSGLEYVAPPVCGRPIP